jgi:5-methylcytosine-specific restriction endonuclease McrA
MVFVLNHDKTPLSPCHQAVARKLLKDGKAAIWRKYPFTIILKEQKETDDTQQQEYRLKIDRGSRHTGLAILQDNKVIWMAQIEHRTDISERLTKRSNYRRRRRSNNLRYRRCKYKPGITYESKRDKGWVPPSLQSGVDNIESWINKLKSLCPLTDLSYENVKFDTQLMANPEISGIEYQQGTLQGYEVREYLLEKYNRTCVYCGITNVPLEVEHIVPESISNDNRVTNLCMACGPCNDKKGTKTAAEFGFPELHEMAQEPMKDAAKINATRWKVLEVLKATGMPVECGTGARTKMNRINLGLVKDHHLDACCVGASTPETLIFKTDSVLYIKAMGRGQYRRTNVDDSGFPVAKLPRKKQFFGYQTGDMVKAVVPKGKHTGTHYGRIACRASGSFALETKHGKLNHVCHKHMTLIQNNDGHGYKISAPAIWLTTNESTA